MCANGSVLYTRTSRSRNELEKESGSCSLWTYSPMLYFWKTKWSKIPVYRGGIPCMEITIA